MSPHSSAARLVRLALLMAAVPLAVSCGGGGGSAPPATPPVAAPPSAAAGPTRPSDDKLNPGGETKLESFSGAQACSALETYVETAALQEMRRRLIESRDNPQPTYWAVPVAAPAPSTGAPNAAAPNNFSTTNLRTNGVDEPDVMKNDGTRMFVISGTDVAHLKSWPANEMREVARTRHGPARPTGLLLKGNRLIVISQRYDLVVGNPLGTGAATTLPGPCIDCRYNDTGKIEVASYDVSNPASPTLERKFEIDGSGVTARMINDSLWLVTNRQFTLPSTVLWSPPPPSTTPPTITPGVAPPSHYPWPSAQARIDAFNAQITANEAAIRAQALDKWLPSPVACTDVIAPNTPSALGWTGLNRIDFSQPLSASSLKTQLGFFEPGLVYATPQHLHLVTQHHFWGFTLPTTATSYVHRMSFAPATGFSWVASGQVEGVLKDEFSIDEAANGDLRLALTLTRFAASPTNAQIRVRSTANQVVVLRRNGAALSKLGNTPELAAGETIQSARFIGDRGFVVTFRQVDPLFTLDLSNPAQPRVLGELKVPGFSTYLHPIDANTLLGIGTFVPEPDANGRVDFNERAVQLALFDVSDMRNPRQTHRQLLGSVGASSAAQWDHKAFNYFDAKKRLAVPLMDWGPATSFATWGNTVSTLKVFDVSPTTGFTARGEIDLSNLARRGPPNGVIGTATPYYIPAISRSVMADDVVYAVSEIAVKAAQVPNLNVTLSEVLIAD
jgi:hypothetical protein